MHLLHYDYPIEQLGERYTLLSLLGRGGMADVYLAWDELDHYEVAVKVIRPDVLDSNTRERFFQERKVGTVYLDHPHIIHIYDRVPLEETFVRLDPSSSSEYKVPYIVMEYITGGDLKKRLVPGQAYPLDETVRIFKQLCSAVEYAHNRGVIHRDIKPSNILFREHPLKGDQVVLSDFGLALQINKPSDPEIHDSKQNDLQLIAGTAVYMAPEQQRGYPEMASDIYSLGVVLYQLCTGYLPSRSQGPKKPTLLNPNLPPALDDVILCALCNKPSERFASASLFWQAIQSAVGQIPLSGSEADIVGTKTSKIRSTPSSMSIPPGITESPFPDVVEQTPLLEMEADIADTKTSERQSAHSSLALPGVTALQSSTRIGEPFFISYSRKDLDIARQIKEDLRERGLEVWMDEDNLIAGTRWDDSIEENVKRSIAVLYLVSPTSRTSPYVYHELEYAQIYKRNIIPLWVLGDTEWAKVVAFGLFRMQYIDLRGEMYRDGIEKLTQTLRNLPNSEALFTSYTEEYSNDWILQEVDGTRNQSLANQMSNERRETLEDTHHQIRNPYKGLRAFEYTDAKFFFGRESLVSQMVEHIETILREEKGYSQVPRCMMIVGASGSGKSSVVMAGLLPALEDRKNVPEVKRWFFLEPIRPGEYPMNALVHVLKLPFLNETKVGFSPLKRWNQTDLRKTLEEPDARGLDELLREITDGSADRVVLIVDQFEEIFAPTVDSDQREQFINLLMTTATEPDTPVLLLFTLRADFYHRILDNDALYRKVKRHLINIPPMTLDELRTVIKTPAKLSMVTFDPYLSEDLLYEVYRRPESLPLLQFTLEQLFEHRDRGEQRMTRQSYDEMEGLKGAINKHAEKTYDKLPTPEHQTEVRKLFTEYFIYISEVDHEPSHLESGEEITRRRVTEADLHLNDLSVRREVVETFVNARLLTATRLVRQSTDLDNIPDITYEISHEALLNAWKRLGEWITGDRKDIYLIQSLRSRIKQWDQENDQKKKKDFLVERSVLQQLQEYRQRKTLGPSTEKFLQASLAQERRRRISGVLSSGVTALVILLLVLGIIFRNVIFPPPPDPTVVTSLADSGPGTLNDVIQKATDGATITFDTSLAGKTIYLALSGLDINKSLTIRGPSGGISITSGETGHYIQIEPGKNVTIENVTFANSYTLKHSIIENAGNLTINNSKMNGNKSYSSYGGGAIDNNGGTLILNSDIIEGNTASSNGGAVYNLFGTVSINNSTLSNNKAYYNGGGIYNLGGVVTVGRGSISNNSAGNNAGGGIDIVNGSLNMHDTQVESNSASGGIGNGIGGGIAIVGGGAFINASVITANTADAGGGIAVTDDTDNNSSSLVKLHDIIYASNLNAIYYIRQNAGGDIAGKVTPVGTDLQILDDTSIDNLGDPPPPSPPQRSSNYLGVADINSFCLHKGDSYGKISNHVDPNATDIMFTCFNQANKAVADFPGQTICQFQYPPSPGDTVIDRMANYFDPTSLQCYKNLNRLGPIGQAGFANYCASQAQYTGLFDDSQYRDTAYDWLCQPKDTSKLPNGLSVTAACNLEYNANLQYDPKNVIDRLANFNTPNGWGCWLAV